LLAVSREFPDERYLAGILRLRIPPLSGGADRLAVHLVVDGVVDNRCRAECMRKALAGLEMLRAAPSQAVERSRPVQISVML
jgi:hypothetical protein